MSASLDPRQPAGRSPFDAIRRTRPDALGNQLEYWSARELQPYLGYDKWERFLDVIERAKASCRNTGHVVLDHFPGAGKMIELGKGAVREVEDFHLTRYACYLVAMNGDPRKMEIAAAQQYFAVQTYRAEQYLPPADPSQPPTPVHPQLVRPWATRFNETFGEHYRHVHMNHPAGSFTVVTAGLMQMLHLEDQLLLHLMPIDSGDRPCISIGKTWSNWLRDTKGGQRIGESPLWLPDQQRFADVAVYGSEWMVTFHVWLHTIYLTTKLHPYIERKPEFKPCGKLPQASVADNTCRGLTGRPAKLPSGLAQQLEDRGGFVPFRSLPEGEPPPAITG